MYSWCSLLPRTVGTYGREVRASAVAPEESQVLGIGPDLELPEIRLDEVGRLSAVVGRREGPMSVHVVAEEPVDGLVVVMAIGN